MTPSVSTPSAEAERIELLPCPFCGNKAEMGRQAGGFIVRCLGCYGTGSERLREDGAVRSWNTRAAQRPAAPVDRETQSLRDEIERLKREADGEFVQAAVRVMQTALGFEARDYADEGISADDFEQFFTEDMNAAWQQVASLAARAEKAEGILAHLSAQPRVAVPEGWKLVPIEPTKAMSEAGWTESEKRQDEFSSCTPRHLYAAMLAAAPSHPTTDAGTKP